MKRAIGNIENNIRNIGNSAGKSIMNKVGKDKTNLENIMTNGEHASAGASEGNPARYITM
jgi:hypothetical protein